MGTNKKYWKGLDELHETPEFIESTKNEFPEELSVDEFLSDDKLAESSTGRRDFLKFLGFSVAAATLAACETPVVKAVPYVVKPEQVTPGMPTWYSSAFYDGLSYANILVKTREGRPIFVKGNRDHGFTQGTINPRISASVLSLYDSERLQAPVVDGEKTTWGVLDSKVIKGIEDSVAAGKKVVLLSGTEISPSTLTVISEFKNKFGGATVAAEGEEVAPSQNSLVEHVQYDAVSYQAYRKANEESFGKAVIPDYNFDKAKTIVSVGADFLNSWLLSTDYVGQYISRRNPDGEWMNKHYQFESNMSLTGTNADTRAMVKPSQYGAVLSVLHKEIVGSALSGVDTSSLSEYVTEKVKEAAKDLKANKGASLLVCGSNDKALQVVVNSINSALNNYSSTINLNNPVNMFNSNDVEMGDLVKEMNAGKVGALIMWNTNPSYSCPNADQFNAGLEKVATTVSITQYADETASKCKMMAAESHALEAWNDYNPKKNHYGLAQPTIRPLFETRSVAESLMVWADMAMYTGKDNSTYHDFIKSNWKKYGYTEGSEYASFEFYWDNAVRVGVDEYEAPAATAVAFAGDLSAAAKEIAATPTGEWEVQLYMKASIADGKMAGNPWLQEMPDTVTKVTWDNYVTMSPEDMKELGLSTLLGQEEPSDVVTVTVGEKTVKLPVFPQPGQAPKTIGIALGYGRGANGEKIGKAAYQTGEYGAHLEGENGGKVSIGANVFPFTNKGNLSNVASIEKTSEVYNLACTQTHSTVMGRNSIVKETTLEVYKNEDPSAYNHQHTLHSGWNHEEKPISEFNLWEDHPVENVGHRWAMSIDLNTCIGCGSCLISCQSENNVPVVGKDEIRRGREMHWLRLDRYYASDAEAAVGTKGEGFDEGGFKALEEAASNPTVVHMPMMCHHCNHAPCETVCPVAATTHSNEGLNMMAYNRCIGTRYCGNNCPYKVRRFNWFNYPSYRKFTEVNPAQDDLGRMVLNPDVVVRTRGVMEKCSFCVQKIQAGKLVAKKEGRPVVDGDVTTACADVCPTDAITVGDWNDVHSAVRTSTSDKRAYQALEEIGVKPNVWYKVKVRNDHNEALETIQKENAHHGHESHEEHAEEAGHEEGHGHEDTANHEEAVH